MGLCCVGGFCLTYFDLVCLLALILFGGCLFIVIWVFCCLGLDLDWVMVVFLSLVVDLRLVVYY